ncbi:ThuA domain-containing protein [bacterium]|nr:ThuA domain-containing protein [bacterium]
MTYRIVRPLLVLLFVLAVSSSLVAEEKTKLKGLLITGGCCHDYPNQIKIITQGLSQRVNIEWDVALAGSGKDIKVPVYENHDWIKPYDIVVHNECYGSVTDVAFVEGIVKAHTENKIPAIFIHCSMHSYRNAKTDKWRELIGQRSTSHEGKHPLDVVTIQSDHPIMKGFPQNWKVDRGELYKIEKTWDTATPLAKAYGVDTKKDHVCIWTNEYEGTKTFSTTLGHYNETMNNDAWLSMMSRGVLWTLGALNEDGTPKAGYEGTGKKEINLEAPNPDKDKKPTPAKK